MSAKKLSGKAKEKAILFAVVHVANLNRNPQAIKRVVDSAREKGLIDDSSLLDYSSIDGDLELAYRSDAIELATGQLKSRDAALEALGEVAQSVREQLQGEMTAQHAGSR